MIKVSFQSVCNEFYKHNRDNNITTQFGDKNPLYAVVVFKQENFNIEYSIESRSYKFRSDNKYFISGMGGNSIFAQSLDEVDKIRLDWILGEWKIDYCYILENKEVENNV